VDQGAEPPPAQSFFDGVLAGFESLEVEDLSELSLFLSPLSPLLDDDEDDEDSTLPLFLA